MKFIVRPIDSLRARDLKNTKKEKKKKNEKKCMSLKFWFHSSNRLYVIEFELLLISAPNARIYFYFFSSNLLNSPTVLHYVHANIQLSLTIKI